MVWDRILTGKEEQGSKADICRWRRMRRSGLCDDDMKAMVFRAGGPGEMVNLVGEYPMEEIGELLGGQADEEMIQLNRRMAAVLRADREELPERYELTYLGTRMRTRGDVVVVHRAMGGSMLRDMTAGDGFEAQGLVTAVEEGI